MASGNAVGIIELGSIYKGYEVQDAVLKAANVEKVVARTICSGKYFILLRGSVGDVETAIAVASRVGGFAVINVAVIPNVDPRVFPAIAGYTVLETAAHRRVGALLILETFSVVSAIKAADIAVKEAELELLRVHVAMAVGGKGFVVMTGDEGALASAVRPAVEYCRQEGMLAGYAIIRNPHDEVLRDLL
ncbi:MAG TPA: BMC domain-containing protein [Bacteroidota bacterium]|nr:BMC domain-containing protein [Bacteroidota bacterium]